MQDVAVGGIGGLIRTGGPDQGASARANSGKAKGHVPLGKVQKKQQPDGVSREGKSGTPVGPLTAGGSWLTNGGWQSTDVCLWCTAGSGRTERHGATSLARPCRPTARDTGRGV